MPRVILSKWTVVVAFTLITASGYALYADIAAKYKGKPQNKFAKKICIQDIPKKFQIVGRLGKPLGELMTIQGTWVHPGLAKDTLLRFHVTQINGEQLPEPVVFYISNVKEFRDHGRGPERKESFDWKFATSGKVPPPKPAKNEVWELGAVETAELNCYSSAAYDAMGPMGAMGGDGFEIRSTIEYILMKKLK